ncbi:MAG TPA: AsmA family protein [Alphaproteobacteria bacterium]|nr:AsmA family protein [Alphaproteobacteria bacterium]
MRPRWSRRIFLYLLLPILIFVAATAAMQAISQLNAFARQVEGLIERAIGREIKIAGGIETSLFRINPTVILKDVTIANAPWGSRPDIAKITHLKVEARLWPILIGEVRLRRISAEGARIWLETRDDGRGNWELAPSGKPGEAGNESQPLVFDDLRIIGANVTFKSDPGAPESRAEIFNLTIRKPPGGRTTVLEARGSLDNLPVEIEAEMGQLRVLFAGKPSQIKFKARHGKSDLSGAVTVTLAVPLRIEGAINSKRLVLGQQAPKPKTPAKPKPKKAAARPAPTPIPAALIKRMLLNVTFAAQSIEAGAVKIAGLAGTLTGTGGKLTVKPLRAVLAGSPLAGSITFDVGRKPTRLAVALSAGRIAAKNLKTYTGGPVIARGTLTLAVNAVSAGDSIEALQRRLNTVVTAKLSNASVIGLPWRPTGATTRVPRLSVTLTAPGLAAPSAKTKAKPRRKAAKKTAKKQGAPDPAAALARLRGRPLKIKLDGVFGRSDIAGTLDLRIGAVTRVTGTLVSRRIDLGTVARKGGKREPLFAPDQLPVELIRGVQGQVSYRIHRAELGEMGIPNIVSTVTLRDRVMTVRSGGAGADAARLHLVMDTRGATTRTSLDVALDDTHLAKVIAGKAGLKLPAAKVTLRLRLRGSGDTLAATVASADGHAVFVLRTPQAEKGTGWVSGLGSGLVGTISTVVTQRGGALRCIVARMPIVKGVGKSNILLIDTERLSFFGRGTLDLSRESVDALFVPRQKFIGASRIKLFTVRMTGPIDRPKAKLDFGSAALATAKSAIGIAWLPVKLLTKLFAGKIGDTLDFDPCPPAIKKALSEGKAK